MSSSAHFQAPERDLAEVLKEHRCDSDRDCRTGRSDALPLRASAMDATIDSAGPMTRRQRWRELGSPAAAGRVSRLDRGWSTVLVSLDEPPLRMRNIGADVAVGDFVVVTDDGERVAGGAAAAQRVRAPRVVRGQPGRGAHHRRQHRRGDAAARAHVAAQPAAARARAGAGVGQWRSPGGGAHQDRPRRRPGVGGRGAAGRGAGRRRARGQRHHRRRASRSCVATPPATAPSRCSVPAAWARARW